MDGGAWWAAVYGVAQSRTRLKRLSSSSSLTSSCGAAESKRLYFCHQLLSQAGFLEEVTFLQGAWCGGGTILVLPGLLLLLNRFSHVRLCATP